MRFLLRVVVLATLSASVLAAQDGPPPGGIPGPGGDPGRRAAATEALDKHELELALQRFLSPEKSGDAPVPDTRWRAGLVLVEQLSCQSKPNAVQDIIDALVSVTAAPDDEISMDGEQRLSIAWALESLADAKLQTAFFTAVRTRLSSRSGYLGRSFALRLLAEWGEHGASSVYADKSIQEWLTTMRTESDFRLAVQAWSVYLANTADGELMALYSTAIEGSESPYPAQINGLILHEVTVRPSLRSKLRQVFS